jgi:hypothetical protein
MAVIAGFLLVLYLGAILEAFFRSNHEEDSPGHLAFGYLLLLETGILILGIALTMGILFDWQCLIEILFWITIVPLIFLFGTDFKQFFRYTFLVRKESLLHFLRRIGI